MNLIIALFAEQNWKHVLMYRHPLNTRRNIHMITILLQLELGYTLMFKGN